MKISIRTKFTFGIVFFFIVIVLLLILSALELNMMTKKTHAILKENHVSIVCAREMTEAITSINQEITNCFILSKYPDTAFIMKIFGKFDNSLHLEKNNITETGEDKLVAGIESAYKAYKDSLAAYLNGTKSKDKIVLLGNKFSEVNQQLILLSQMNSKATEFKTNDAKVSAKKALGQMTILGSFCFLIVLSFTFSFSSYFNQRFYQLHNGIKEIVSYNYGQRLHFDGKDEFSEIALAFNEMAEKLDKNVPNVQIISKPDIEKEIVLNDVQELKRILAQMKTFEEQAAVLISKLNSLNK